MAPPQQSSNRRYLWYAAAACGVLGLLTPLVLAMGKRDEPSPATASTAAPKPAGPRQQARQPAATTPPAGMPPAITPPLETTPRAGFADPRVPTPPASVPREAAPSEPYTPPPRRVEIRHGAFYVDGEQFMVKAVGYSPARPGTLPWRDATALALMEEDFKRISAAGFNTIRTWQPLRPEALAVADQYGLMVLQGIWLDRPRDYRSTAYKQSAYQDVTAAVVSIREHTNILGVLVGNELPVDHVFLAGLEDTEDLLRQMYQAVKDADPSRLVSFANWPHTAMLDQSFFDFISYNTYDYNPLSVSHSMGYQGYVEYLARTQAQQKPLVVTEFGLSVSPQGTGQIGYGGNSAAQQAAGVVRLWDAVIQSGAAGGSVFEWMDEWWKNYDYPGDEKAHDETDPEEWFGLTAVTDSTQLHGTPRPALAALTQYNTAMLVSPTTTVVHGRVPIRVYNVSRVRSVRVRVDDGPWQALRKEGQHWWHAIWDATQAADGVRALTMEALDAQDDVVASTTRHVWNASHDNPHGLPWVVEVTSADATVVTKGKLVPVTFEIRVRNSRGQPVAGYPVRYAIAEPQLAASLHDTQSTNEVGILRVKYLVRESGILSCSAGVEFRDGAFLRRFGDEEFLMVRTGAKLAKQSARALHEASGGAAPTLLQRLGPGLQDLVHVEAAWPLRDHGTELPVDYEAYGTFVNPGKPNYHYAIKDTVGLSKAVGEGIYPNEISIFYNPAYKYYDESGELEGDHWQFVNIDDTRLSYVKWATTGEEPGVKQFYTAAALERAGHIRHAIKAYYAILVHYPQSLGWTFFQTPWSVGKGALDRVYHLTRLYPELGLTLVGAEIDVRHGYDNDVDNDQFVVNPGRLVAAETSGPDGISLAGLKVVQTRGTGRVQLVQFENGHWQMRVAGQPYVVRAVTYDPTAVGESPDVANMREWTKADRDDNGILDVLETWVDVNRNEQRDANEGVVGDFALLQRMGANTLRLYHHGAQHREGIDPAVLRQLHQDYGLYVVMGDFVGMYTVGSGATWEEGTDYRDPKQRASMRASVQQMVKTFKDEPYILMWVLGNENNYGGMHGVIGGVGNAGKYPDVYYAFVNELAEWIHEADPNHPVVLGNGEVLHLDVIAKHAPAIDVMGMNSYRGASGFSHTIWKDVQRLLDKPAFITEYGCPAYHRGQSQEVAEWEQAQYHLSNWLGIEQNLAGAGVGNAIGGSAFEWVDEFWKAGQPPRFHADKHEAHASWAGPFPGGWSFEEWYGLTSQGAGQHSPFLRQLRPVYTVYQRLWSTEPTQTAAGP